MSVNVVEGVMMKTKQFNMELDLCCLAQGYEDVMWSVWLNICPSPFSWFKYRNELREMLK